jgi:nucleoside phosphorylase
VVNKAPIVHFFTATQREANAARALIHHRLNSQHVKGIRSHWIIDDTKNFNLNWRVFISHTRMLNVVSALEVAHSVAAMPDRPDLFVYVACAGAIREEVKIGDVLVPTKVGYYEPAKEAYDRDEARVHLIPRIDWLHLDGGILDVVSLLDGEESSIWKKLCFNETYAKQSSAHLDQEYISGEKV